MKKIFFIGIKGVAMANLALIYKQKGYFVSGSDVADTFITDYWLQQASITVCDIKDDLPDDIDIVVYAAGHAGSRGYQAQQAVKMGKKLVHQAQLIAELSQEYHKSIAISGCHGKTTTTTLMAHCLKRLGAEPGYLIGTSNFGSLPAGDAGQSRYFIFEADEYGLEPPQNITPKLNSYSPNLTICTGIDWDHPDVYNSLEATEKTFAEFFSRTAALQGLVVANCDNKSLHKIIQTLPLKCRLTYGINPGFDYQITDIVSKPEGIKFKLSGHDGIISDFSVALYGKHNAGNAAAVIISLMYLGYHPKQIHMALEAFSSPKRRFELLGQVGKNLIFDDYAHHPAEIAATIQAAREHFPGRRVVVIFQPHTFSRTSMLQDDFAKTLSGAGYALIAPIFPSAREQSDKFSVTSHTLAQLATKQGKNNVFAFDNFTEIIPKLQELLQPQDIIFTMGAGEIYRLKDQIFDCIKKKFIL